MPFTPYHFGINTLPGLGTKGRLDICVLIAANILIDVEVLADNYFAPGWPTHQLWHFHTLLIGGLAGACLGAVFYGIKPLRLLCRGFNSLMNFDYAPTLLSLILSGMIGAWLHVLVDGLYHNDVEVFWPIHGNPLIRGVHNNGWLRTILSQPGIIRLCLLCWAAAGTLSTFFILNRFVWIKKIKSAVSRQSQ